MAVQDVQDQNFHETIQNNGKVVVKYYADWCGSCKLLAPKYRRISEDDQYEDVAFLNINAEKNPEARKTAGVDNLPFIAVFKDGQMVQGEATSKEDQLRAMIEQLKN